MPAIQRLTDANSAGGIINSIPQTTVFANNLRVSINGSIGSSHPPCPTVPIHCQGNWTTANGSSRVYVAGIPVNFTGNADTCGHTRVGGSSNVFIE